MDCELAAIMIYWNLTDVGLDKTEDSVENSMNFSQKKKKG